VPSGDGRGGEGNVPGSATTGQRHLGTASQTVSAPIPTRHYTFLRYEFRVNSRPKTRLRNDHTNSRPEAQVRNLKSVGNQMSLGCHIDGRARCWSRTRDAPSDITGQGTRRTPTACPFQPSVASGALVLPRLCRPFRRKAYQPQMS